MYRTGVQRCNSAKCRAEVERMRRATESEIEGDLVGLGFDRAPRTRSHEESKTLAPEPGTAGMLKPEMQRITGAKKAADHPSGGPQVSLAAGTEAARWGTADAELRGMQGSEHTGPASPNGGGYGAGTRSSGPCWVLELRRAGEGVANGGKGGLKFLRCSRERVERNWPGPGQSTPLLLSTVKKVLHGASGIWGGPGDIGSSAHLGRIGRGVGGEHGRISAPKISIGSVQGRRWVGRGFEVDRQAGGATRGRSDEFPQVTGEIERNWSECRVVTSSSERSAGWRTFGEVY
ncbi:hypothetical protein FB451DRAFT_1190965 [Mycena latifolia]|nr:hypothetical protein FB451DRAFT_1190965 [Mycena latifolia]